MAYKASVLFKDEKVQKIPYGVHTNCSVVSVVALKNEYVDINVEDSEGRVQNKRLWWPNDKYPNKIKNADGTQRDETSEETIRRGESNLLIHIVKLMHIFLGKEELEKFPELDFEPFVSQAIKLLTPKLSTKKVNLKLIYDSEGLYSTFGNFPDYIEECVPNQEPNLKYSPWEKDNRCTYKGDKEIEDNSADLRSLFAKS